MKPKYKQLTIALAMAGIGHAATISLDTGKSGRAIGSTGTDFVVTSGGTFANTAFSTNNSLIGDNPSNDEFIGLWTFVADAAFVADIATGKGANLAFSGGRANNGTPSQTTVSFLAFDSTTGVDGAKVNSLLSAGGTSIGTFTFDSGNPGAARSFSVSNSQLSGITAGQQIYFAFDNVLSTNGAADNFHVNAPGTGATFDGANLPTLTTVPEPSSALLSVLAVAAIGLRRKRS